MSDDIFAGFRRGGEAPRAKEAEEAFRNAYLAQQAGRLEEARRGYRRSIELFPTAEAHTFLGWTYSFEGRLEEAIAECKRAIEVDPEFGNPYNDIGAYLVELGRLEEAPEWLERAKRAVRYEPRHFPYVNLARVYTLRGELKRAIRELKASLEVSPENSAARREIRRLQAWLN